MAFAAAVGGVRSLATMKGPGANVASDALLSAAYGGVNSALVVLVADDPGPHTTQTEQDSRYYGFLANLPILEPSTVQEAKDLLKAAVKISEKYSLPVIYRTTTRVNHSSANVKLGAIPALPEARARIRPEPERFIRASMRWNLSRHKWVLSKLKELKEDPYVENLVQLSSSESKLGIVCSGVSYVYVAEVLSKMGLRDSVDVLKLNLTYPIPERIMRRFFDEKEKVLVVEELEPILELQIRSLLTLWNLDHCVDLLGKLDGTLPRYGEFHAKLVEKAVLKLLGRTVSEDEEAKAVEVPSRPPPFCAGCPHMASYYILLKAISDLGYKKDEVPIIGDIGCYALSFNPPLRAIWFEHCMGASIGIAAGLKLAGFEKPVIATIGDSTFLHAGMPALVDVVHLQLPVLVVILDNGTVAMTGHQPHPATDKRLSPGPVRKVDLLQLVKGMGVDDVVKLDPYDVKSSVDVVKEKLAKLDHPTVVIFERACAVVARRMGIKYGVARVNQERCTACNVCIRQLGCIALERLEDGKVRINQGLCNGCGVCAQICPFKAIEVVKG